MTNPSYCYLNGEYMPLEDARIPVLDRGFIFGDGIYEVIPVYGGRLFRLTEHLQRLANSLEAIRLDNPYSDQEWADILQGLVARNDGDEQAIYLQVTRGVAKRDHGFPAQTEPTVFAMSSAVHPVDASLLNTGISAITLDDIRWRYCHIKTIALLPNILLRQQALDEEAVEAILIRDGEVTEGAASNVFIVDKGVIKTPPKSECLLPGITRDLIVELAHKHQAPCEETSISEAQLLQAEEVWISSSTKEVLPVTRLNNNTVGDGHPGPVWRTMHAIYQDYKQSLRQAAQAS